MADIKALRNRIKSVDNTMHLTKAMGLVASSKIRRATDAMMRGRQFSEAVEELVRVLTTSNECLKSPYMTVRETGRDRIVVIAGDRGMAGGYNNNVFKLAKNYPDAEFIPVGKRACDRFGRERVSSEHFTTGEIYELAEKLCADFAAGLYDRLGLIGTKYHTVLKQEPEIEWILPLTRWEGPKKEIIFEPDEISILQAAVPEYVSGKISAALKESFACEVTARRNAMDNASRNAEEMIGDLTIQYNRARQGGITQEITEIVASTTN